MKWYIILIIISLLIISVRARIKKRGYLMKDKQGKEVTPKEFMKRWKDGVEGITALQQAKMQIMGIWITITGIIAGMVVNALVRMEDVWWWVEIILVGSLILTLVQFLGTWQKYIKYKMSEEIMKNLNKGKEK